MEAKEFETWYEWFIGMMGRKPDKAEKNALIQLAEISLEAGAVNERARILGIIDEYGLDKCSARDDVMERQAKGWQALGEK